MKFKPIVCLECGKHHQPNGPNAVFCCVKCKQDFANRRRERGAILYDIVMRGIFDEPTPAATLFARIENFAAGDCRDEDNRKRNGRRSWQ